MSLGTLSALLHDRLREEPDAEACRLVSRDGSETPVTVRALLGKAMAYAQRFGPPGDERQSDRKIVGVCLYHGLDLHAAFLGGLWAGHVPTMLPPPSPRMEAAKYTHSFCQLLRHVRPACVVIDRATHARLDGLELGQFPGSELIDAESVPEAAEVTPAAQDPDDVALLQHSSGTTGLQKGIALSHRAILAHNEIYAAALGITKSDVIVSWLPLYHDMGFVACFLLPLLRRVRLVEISPFDWVLRPGLLLEQIQRHRGTLCWLPNFAYSFLAESARHLPEDLDLSSVRAFINCSEPVYHSSHEAFLRRFGRHGVSAETLTASYAMAENVYAISQSLPGQYRTLSVSRRRFTDEHRVIPEDQPGSLTFVSNGRPLPGTRVAVLDGDGKELPEGCVGELAIQGRHRFSGYFRRDDLTQQSMTADGWYRTGDLGFLHQGEVYVTGRKKDLIIIQGRNFYPTDIEEAAGRVEGVVPGRVVAFGIPDEHAGTERLVVLCEIDQAGQQDEKKFALRVRNHVAQEMDCAPADVRVVPPRWLVKSTSGKLARNDNREKYLRTFVKTADV